VGRVNVKEGAKVGRTVPVPADGASLSLDGTYRGPRDVHGPFCCLQLLRSGLGGEEEVLLEFGADLLRSKSLPYSELLQQPYSCVVRQHWSREACGRRTSRRRSPESLLNSISRLDFACWTRLTFRALVENLADTLCASLVTPPRTDALLTFFRFPPPFPQLHRFHSLFTPCATVPAIQQLLTTPSALPPTLYHSTAPHLSPLSVLPPCPTPVSSSTFPSTATTPVVSLSSSSPMWSPRPCVSSFPFFLLFFLQIPTFPPAQAENFRALCTGEKGVGKSGKPVRTPPCSALLEAILTRRS
jgi:hypothetical protein